MLVVCDVDGCIADVRDIVKRYLPDWDEYFEHQLECPAIREVVRVVVGLIEGGADLVFITGRPESVRPATELWLELYVTRLHRGVVMRPSDFEGPTWELKLGWFRTHRPDLIIDDDPQVVDAAVQAGYTVLQVCGYRWSGVRDYSPNEKIPVEEVTK